MFTGSNNYSLSDIAAVTNGNDGFGGGNNGFWWIIILVLLFGWGGYGRGFGGFGGGYASESSSVYEGYVLNNDFSQLSRQIDNGFSEQRGQGIQIANGIASLGYDQLAQMNNINSNISSSANSLLSAMNTNTNAINAGITGLGSQIASCCCDNKYLMSQNFSDINYRMASDTCAINTNIATSIRDVIDNDNANYRALDARLTAMEMANKDSKIADQQSQIFALQLAASQQAQNNYIVGQLKPSPSPCYVVPNPAGCGCCCG